MVRVKANAPVVEDRPPTEIDPGPVPLANPACVRRRLHSNGRTTGTAGRPGCAEPLRSGTDVGELTTAHGLESDASRGALIHAPERAIPRSNVKPTFRRSARGSAWWLEHLARIIDQNAM